MKQFKDKIYLRKLQMISVRRKKDTCCIRVFAKEVAGAARQPCCDSAPHSGCAYGREPGVTPLANTRMTFTVGGLALSWCSTSMNPFNPHNNPEGEC